MVGHIAALQTSSGSSGATGSLKLEPGTEVRARVVSSGADNVLRLAVGKETVEVQASAPLPKGTEVTLKVSGEAARPQIEIFTAANQVSQPSAKGTQSPQPVQTPQTQQAGASTPPLSTPVTTSSASQIITNISPQPLPQAGGTVVAVVQPDAAGAVPVTAKAISPLPLPQSQPQPQPQPQSQSQPQAQPPVSAGKVEGAPASAVQSAGSPQPTAGGAPAPSAPAAGTIAASSSGQPAASLNGAAASAATPENAATPTSTVRVVPGNQPVGQAGPSGAQPGSAPGTGPAVPQAGQASAAGGAPNIPAPGAAVTPAATATSQAPASGQPVSASPQQTAIPQTGVPQPATGGPAAAPQAPAGAPQAPAAAALPSSAGPPSGSPGAAATVSSGQPGPAGPVGPAGPGANPQPGQPAASAPVGLNGGGPPSTPQGVGGQPAVQPAAQPAGQPAAATPAGGNTQTFQTAPLPGQPAAAGLTGGGTGQPAPQVLPSGTSVPPAGQSSSVFQPQTGSGVPAGTAPGLSLSPLPTQISGRLTSVYPQAAPSAAGTGAQNTRLPVSQPLAEAAGKLLPGLESQQASVAGVFAQIGALSAAASAGKIALPEPVKQVMQQLFGLRLGGSGSVTGKDVAQAVKTSGLFRENTLTQGAKPQSADLKSLLGQLRGLLDGLGIKGQPVKPFMQPPVPSLHQAPKGQRSAGGSTSTIAADDGVDPKTLLTKLMQDTDSALSRIRLSQMVSRGLGGDDGQGTQVSHGKGMDVVMDLPLAVGQETAVLQMQIGRDPEHDGGENGEEQAWRLRFGLDLTATGPLEAAVSLRGGGTFVSLWLEREEMHRTLGEQRETIEAAFADAGLDLQELRFIRGLPIRSKPLPGARVDRQS